jgi:hypothetical protein
MPRHHSDDVTQVLTCRSGICLPFVCKAFRSVLQDLQHARLWGTISPFYYILPPDKYRYSSQIKPERWLALRNWLETRANGMYALHIKYAYVYKLHANARVCTHSCPTSHTCMPVPEVQQHLHQAGRRSTLCFCCISGLAHAGVHASCNIARPGTSLHGRKQCPS